MSNTEIAKETNRKGQKAGKPLSRKAKIILLSAVAVVLILVISLVAWKATRKTDPIIGSYTVVSVISGDEVKTYDEAQTIQFKDNGYFELSIDGLGHYIGTYEKSDETQEGASATYTGQFLHDSVSNLDLSIALDEEKNQVILYITGSQFVVVVAEKA